LKQMNNPLCKTHQSFTPKYSLGAGWVMILIAWLLLIALFTYFFMHWESKRYNPNQQLQTIMDSSGVKQLILKRNHANHYVATGWVNGHKATLIVDTGATSLVIPAHLARRWNVVRGRKSLAGTAAGQIVVYATRVDSLRLGDIEIKNVRAIINPEMKSDIVLVGMSVLRTLDFHQRGDTLTIIQYPRSLKKH